MTTEQREYWTPAKFEQVAKYMLMHNMPLTQEKVREAAIILFGAGINLASINQTRVNRIAVFVDGLERAAKADREARLEETLRSKGPMADLILKGMMAEVVEAALAKQRAELTTQFSTQLARQSAMIAGLLAEHQRVLCEAFGVPAPTAAQLPAPDLSLECPQKAVEAPRTLRRKLLVYGVQASQKRAVEDALKTEDGLAASRDVTVEFLFSNDSAHRVKGSYHTIVYLQHFVDSASVMALKRRGQNVVGLNGSGSLLALEVIKQLTELQIEMEQERENDRISKT